MFRNFICSAAIAAFSVGSTTAQVELLGDGVAKMSTYYDGGKKQSEGYFKYGNKCGKWIEWHENGTQKAVKYYDSEGEATGKWTEWYENGTKKFTMVYKEGKIDGKWIWWKENGIKWHEVSYRNGEVDGKWSFWNNKGKTAEKGNYSAELLHPES